MEKREFSIMRLENVPDAARQVLAFSQKHGGQKVFAFYGEMGVGKTTLIKEICKALGSADSFSSPSYSIVNEYLGRGTERIYHIDLYRVKNTDELFALGLEEYLNGGHCCFIEWPELAEPFLPADVIKVGISVEEDMRKISIFIE